MKSLKIINSIYRSSMSQSSMEIRKIEDYVLGNNLKKIIVNENRF